MRCAGAGTSDPPETSRFPEVLRAGTPQMFFAPLVTPYEVALCN